MALCLVLAGACARAEPPPVAPGAGLTRQPRAMQKSRDDGYVGNTALVQVQVFSNVVGACTAQPMRLLDFGWASADGRIAPVRPGDPANPALVKVNGPPGLAYQLFPEAEAEGRRLLGRSERPIGSQELFGAQSIRVRLSTDRDRTSGVHGADGSALFSIGGEALHPGRDGGRYLGTMRVRVGYQ